MLSPVSVEMLKSMENVFRDFGIDYYLVGAVARDIYLSADIEAEALRKTEDIDIAITINDACQYNELKKALISTRDFTSDATEAIKLYYKGAIEVDLLPFGEIESINRTVNLIDPTFILNMPGFKEIYPFVNDIEVENNFTVKVCTMEGIILLKLIANNDRPQRTKDISDIGHIINVYFDLYSGNIYEEHFDIMDSYNSDKSDYLQLVCSRVIGRKIKQLLKGSDELNKRIEQILAKRPTAWWQAMLDGMKDKL
ncbi:MAG: nucleotidyl transferase AbiEii/AbiGii toxin family protein [Pelobium sp.]